MSSRPDLYLICSLATRRYLPYVMKADVLVGAKLPKYERYVTECSLFFADNDFKKFNFNSYVESVKKTRPFVATVPDIFDESSFSLALDVGNAIVQHVKSALIFIPKSVELLDKIPYTIGGKPVMLGYSVPSRYGQTEVPVDYFKGRPVHLLGGTPRRHFDLFDRLCVISLDVNVFGLLAQRGLIYYNRKFHHWSSFGKDRLDIYEIVYRSLLNYMDELSGRFNIIRGSDVSRVDD